TQKIQQVLFLRRRKSIEVIDRGSRFRSANLGLFKGLEEVTVYRELIKILVGEAIGAAGVGGDRLQQVGGAAIMHEEQPLAQTPQRRCAELIRLGVTLVHTVVQL